MRQFYNRAVFDDLAEWELPEVSRSAGRVVDDRSCSGDDSSGTPDKRTSHWQRLSGHFLEQRLMRNHGRRTNRSRPVTPKSSTPLLLAQPVKGEVGNFFPAFLVAEEV